MSKVSMSTRIPVPADQAWKLIGEFNALADWHPAVEKSESAGEGSVRTLTLAGSGTITERLECLEHGKRQYIYSMMDSPLPVSNYIVTIRVHDQTDGRASLVEWSSEFQPVGVREQEAINVVQGIY